MLNEIRKASRKNTFWMSISHLTLSLTYFKWKKICSSIWNFIKNSQLCSYKKNVTDILPGVINFQIKLLRSILMELLLVTHILNKTCISKKVLGSRGKESIFSSFKKVGLDVKSYKQQKKNENKALTTLLQVLHG